MAVGEQRVDDSTPFEPFSVFTSLGGLGAGVFLGGRVRFLRAVGVLGVTVLAIESRAPG